MNTKTLKKKQQQDRDRQYLNQVKIKTYKDEYYTINSVFGNDWAMFYALLGGREAGKSYTVMKWACNRKMKFGDQFKFYWFRLTDSACKALLSEGADKLIDPDIKRKMGVQVETKGSTVYTYKERTHVTKNGTEKVEKYDKKEFCEVLSCSTFYNTKGVGYFDNEFKGEYILVLDEMNREQSEKNNFDIVYNFVNLCENVARSTKHKIRVVMIGNTLDEASDILSAFNFIPDRFGRFKLKSKRCVIDYIMPNEKYRERRKGTIADILMPEASTFTNEMDIDRSMLVNKRKAHTPQYVLAFSKYEKYTVWNDNIVKCFNGEDKPVFGMRRYLDCEFNRELVESVFERFDARAFRYTNTSTFKRFQKQLRLLKK